MKPLTHEDANPCMKCGSVQCSFCSEDVKFAVELAKKMQSNCRKVIMMIIKRLNPDLLKALNNVLDEYDITIDQCFPVFQEQLEKEGK